MAGRSVVLALSFGKPKGLISNTFIASLAIERSRGEIPIVADRSIPLSGCPNIIYIGAKKEEDHISTPSLVKEFIELVMMKGWKKSVCYIRAWIPQKMQARYRKDQGPEQGHKRK